MKVSFFLKSIFLCLIIFFTQGKTAAQQQNTILIIADDLSPDYLGVFSSTTDTAVTPNIRALAQRGIKFTKVWASPLCSPTRAGIITGRYPFRTGVGTVVTSATTPQLDTAEMSIAKLLKYYAPVKYNTACVGKWNLHVATPTKRNYPSKLGFNFYSGNFSGQLTNYYTYSRITNGVLDTVRNVYATTQTVNDAIGWMDTMSTNKPFFLWLAFNAPHFPFHLPPANLCNTAGLSGTTADINGNPKKYFKAAIQAMDTEIGRLFQYLDAHNLTNNTNIIFIGDNGNEIQVAQIADPNKAKATLYDYGVRVPMIIAGPAVANPHRSIDALVSTPDIFATIAELSGFSNWRTRIPTGRVVDSKSFTALITNQSPSIRTWTFTDQFNSPATAADGKTIRNTDYHLIRFDSGGELLFNQTLDPEENIDLLTHNPTATDITNYHFLCDSLNTLMGTTGCQTLATNTETLANKVFVFPNPASSYLQVETDLDLQGLRLTNLLGEEVAADTAKKMQLPLVPNGVYYLHILLKNNQVVHKKIIITQ